MTLRKKEVGGFTLVELLVVIGIIALLIAILMPALSRARKQALQVSCGSNERQVTYAMLAYANDWEQQLPTRSGWALNTPGLAAYIGHYPSGASPMSLNFISRMPIIGFDTATIWDWATYTAPTLEAWSISRGGGPEVWVGGVAFMMRDYLKNDFDIYICPDGWYGKSDMLGKWTGCVGHGLMGPSCTCLGAMGLDCEDALVTYRTGYLWLPHRANTACVFANCTARFCNAGPMTDDPGEVAKSASGAPELLVLADYNFFTYHGVGDCPTPPVNANNCGVAANHNGSDYRRLPSLGSNCAPRITIPDIMREADPRAMPLGMNKSRIDARTKWQAFQDWNFFRWLEYTAWHSF